MENSLYVGLSRQAVLQRAMTTIANNVANMSSPGYRTQNPLFKEFISDPQGSKEPLSMVYDYGQYTTTAPGPQTVTGNTYDVALNGPGFIGITLPSGDTQYTRAGNFTINNIGEIVTANGYAVASAGGAAIAVPQGTREVKITATGDVIADGNTVGTLQVVEFENLQDLRPEGNGLYSNQGNAPTPAVQTEVRQGMIEGSNVNGVVEMTRMIEVSRDYQSTMRMVNNEDERQRNAVQRIFQVTS